MRKQWFGAMVALTTVLGLALPAAAEAPDRSESSWIVALVDGSDPSAEAPGLARSHGGRSGHIYEYALSGFQFFGSEQAANNLARNPRVRSVMPDGMVHAVEETVPTGVSRIGAPTAHAAGHQGSGAVVAVIDTGIDLDHPDLAANIHPSLGKNCTNKRRSPNDDNGHGTHVAGTIAATHNNDLGVIGVAPGAKLVPVKVLNSAGSGTWADVICGIDYVTANATVIRVANMSLGGSGSASNCNDGGMREAICSAVGAGVTFVVAAGNDAKDASTFVPAAYPEALTVSAFFGGENVFAYFSNFGPIVDVMAPGVNIYSTVIGGYDTASGTSMAAPHVAGVAALAIAAGTATSPAEVEALLQSTGECPDTTTNDGGSTCAGQGLWSGDPDGVPEPLVNAARAVAGGSVTTPPTSGSITLEASVETPPGKSKNYPVTLTWTGGSGPVQVLRNTVVIASTVSESSYIDSVRSGTYTYKVCSTADALLCSNTVSVTIS